MEINATVEITHDMLVPWYKRLINVLIDGVMLFVIFVILWIIAVLLAFFGVNGFLIWLQEIDGVTDRLFTTLIMVLYLFIMELTTQRTVGKFVTGTIVVSEDGTKPEPRSFLIRALCRIIPFEVFTFFGSTPRGWHDSAAGTYVVDTKKYKAALALKNSFEEIGSEPVL